jgi:hypothetical protein
MLHLSINALAAHRKTRNAGNHHPAFAILLLIFARIFCMAQAFENARARFLCESLEICITSERLATWQTHHRLYRLEFSARLAHTLASLMRAPLAFQTRNAMSDQTEQYRQAVLLSVRARQIPSVQNGNSAPQGQLARPLLLRSSRCLPTSYRRPP